jgi:RHH-type transcriptional regulator, rel operon repressor / antitoxin RelB
MGFSVQLPNDLEMRLQHLSTLTGRSKIFYIQEAILRYLDDLEDLYLAEHELEEIQSGRATTVSLEEMMKRYGMES